MKIVNMASALLGLAASLMLTAAVAAQTAPLDQDDVTVHLDSGLVDNRTDQRAVIFSTIVASPNASWLRLRLDEVVLGETPRGGQDTILRITSLHDGAVQTMNAEHVKQWRNTTAYFNGNVLLVEIVADPGSGFSRIAAREAWAGAPVTNPVGTRSICGPTDDRLPSDDPRNARLMPIGCTCWLFNDANKQFLTAGHCIYDGIGDIAEFNVPLSLPSGQVVHPGPEDQYPVDPDSVQSNGGQGMGDDWAYFGCFPNSNTGLTAYEAQGDYYILEMPPPVQTQEIRITGYGTVTSPITPTWNQVQKTHVGPYFSFTGTHLMYTTDTSGGNSGSPVILEDTGAAIGIHTHGGCASSGGNTGTGANHPDFLDALANPQGVCMPLPSIAFEFPNGFPDLLSPPGDTLRVHVVDGNGGSPEPGTGMFYYDAGAGYVTVPMIELSPNVYDAVFPAIDCGTLVSYYFSAEDTDGGLVINPFNAPLTSYGAYTAFGYDNALVHDLSVNPGWDMTGEWDYGQPTGQGGTSHGLPDPTSGATGPNVLGVNLNGDYSTSSGGPYTLTTDAIDCSALPGVALRFQRWLNTDYQPYVSATLEVSSNGTTWHMVWENGSNEVTANSWEEVEYDITPWVGGESTVYIRWGYEIGSGAWAYSGWNIDDIQVYGLDCSGCPADINGDGVVDVVDLLSVLAAWGNTGGPEDINGDGIVSVLDLLQLLSDWGPC